MNDEDAIIINDTDDDDNLEEKGAVLASQAEPSAFAQGQSSSTTSTPQDGANEGEAHVHQAVLTPTRKKRAAEGACPPYRQLTLVPVPPTQARPSVPRFSRAEWPHHVVHLRSNFNPDGIAMPPTPTFGTCGCTTPCRRHICQNAKLGIFCTAKCCPFAGDCGNGLLESKSIALVKETATMSFTVLATKLIPKGVVIGQYLGRMSLAPPRAARVQNRGYRLLMHEGPKGAGSWRLSIDAEVFGSMMRFVNHSCKPNANLHEVSNGTMHTVVVGSIRDIRPGEVITVDYGDDLWFVCKCGYKNCRHRGMQSHKQL